MTDFKQTFGRELESGLKKIGFDLRGQYPLLKTGMYTLDVDFDKSKVTIWYGYLQEKLASKKLSAIDVVKELLSQHKQITEHDFDDDTFIRTLHDIVGDRAPVKEIIKKFVDRNVYGTKTKKTVRACLSYDLHRLKTRRFDDMELSMVTATRSYTQHKADNLWVPTNDQGQGMYVSHIRFRKIKPKTSDVRADIDATVKEKP